LGRKEGCIRAPAGKRKVIVKERNRFGLESDREKSRKGTNWKNFEIGEREGGQDSRASSTLRVI